MYLDLGGIIAFLVIGLIAGWLANVLTGRRSESLLMDIILGIAGAFVGGWLLRVFGFFVWGFPANLITAVIGAVVILWLYQLLTGKNGRIRNR